MRIIRESEHTKVIALDEPDQSGACHVYEIRLDERHYNDRVGYAWLQRGSRQQNDFNGIQNGAEIEDLIAICIDRLEGFQNGTYPCHENEQALVRLQNALSWLDSRTKNRKQRGVEGKISNDPIQPKEQTRQNIP